MDVGENVNVHTRQWALQPESEYRFELDPGTTLAIKVRLILYTILMSVFFFLYFKREF